MRTPWLTALAAWTLLAGAAYGQAYQYAARTAAPVTRSGAVIAGTLTWQCSGSECRISGPWPAPGVSACAALAGQVGRIASYGRSGAMLSAAQLTQCNANVPVATLQVSPSVAAQIARPQQQQVPQVGVINRGPSSASSSGSPSTPSSTPSSTPTPPPPAPDATSQVALEPGGRPQDLVVHVLSVPSIRFYGVTPAMSPPTLPAPATSIVSGRIVSPGISLQGSAPGATPTPRSSSTPETPTYARGLRSDVVLRIPVSLRDMPADTWGIEFNCGLYTSRFVPYVTRERRAGEDGTGLVSEPAPGAEAFSTPSGRSGDREVAFGVGSSFIRSIGNYSATFDIPMQTRPFYRIQDARSYACTVYLRTGGPSGNDIRVLYVIAGPEGPAGFRPAAGTTPILRVEGNLQ